jgi:hypothetical protein
MVYLYRSGYKTQDIQKKLSLETKEHSLFKLRKESVIADSCIP